MHKKSRLSVFGEKMGHDNIFCRCLCLKKVHKTPKFLRVFYKIWGGGCIFNPNKVKFDNQPFWGPSLAQRYVGYDTDIGEDCF